MHHITAVGNEEYFPGHIIFGGYVVFFSCKDDYTICSLSKDVRFTAGFYQHIGGTDISFNAPALTIYQLNSSSPIYNMQANLKAFGVPLNPAADSSRYVIRISGSSAADTLTVVYTTSSTNLSADCGSVQYNNITALHTTTHTIDSVKIIQPAVNTIPVENARLYF